jgi:hypothetical protein
MAMAGRHLGGGAVVSGRRRFFHYCNPSNRCHHRENAMTAENGRIAAGRWARAFGGENVFVVAIDAGRGYATVRRADEGYEK